MSDWCYFYYYLYFKIKTMKKEEVRIGNIVGMDALNVFPPNFISGIKPTILGAIREEDFEPVCLFTGVVLTGEWLEKFGFKNGSNSSQGGAMHKDGVYLGILGMHPNFEYCFNAESSTNKSCTLQYVHQLQNLYHSLTGEDLEIK